MKALLFLAIILYASVATTSIDFKQIFASFVNNLKMADTQKAQVLSNADVCFQSINQVFTDGQNQYNIYRKDDPTTANDKLNKYLTQKADEIIIPKCNPVYDPLATYFKSQKTAKIDDFNYYITTFFQPNVLQLFTGIISDLSNGAYTTLGEKMAKLYNAIALNSDAKLPAVPIRFQARAFSREFMLNFLQEYGASLATIDTAAYCVLDFLQGIDGQTSPLVISAKLVETMGRCEKLLDVSAPLYALLSLMQVDGPTFLSFLNQQFARNPTFASSYSNLGSHISAGQYALAGQDFARVTQTLLTIFLQLPIVKPQ